MNCLPPTITDNRIRKVEKSPKIILGLTDNEDNLNEEEKHDQSSKEISFLNDTSIGSYITQIEKIYCQPESLRQDVLRIKPDVLKDVDELERIYYLMESHATSLRLTTTLKWTEKDGQKSDKIDDVALQYTNKTGPDSINKFLNKIKELPKEWTLVQLTSQYGRDKNFIVENTYITPGIDITVFNCGENFSNPFLIPINGPFDPVTRNRIHLIDEMHNIIKENRNFMTTAKSERNYEKIYRKRESISDRLKLLINDIHTLWLKHWRCLFVGRFQDLNLEKRIKNEIKKGFANECPNMSANILYILLGAAKCAGYCQFKYEDIRNILVYCFPGQNKTFLKYGIDLIKNLSDKYNLRQQEKYPVILIVDDLLDIIPWEMMDVIQTESIYRLPSFHFVYVLYKTHKNDIKDGYKIIKDYNKGAYVVNPDQDLKNMEVRIMNFYNYWCPEWTGISGYKPTNDEFYELLTSASIFSYNGHGSGSQHMRMERIQRCHVKAIVLLWGCSSSNINRTGPHMGFYGSYRNYLIAQCPGVVGMLWEVTDTDTDYLTTEFLSSWIPSNAPIHWKHVNKDKWKKADKIVVFCQDETLKNGKISLEPDLAKALNSAKKSVKYLITKAACVVRGIPVKIETQYY